MKKIECIIRPDRLPLVEQALRNEQVGGMTVSEVKGFGRQRKTASAKIKIEMYVMEMDLHRVLDALQVAAYTGKVGDGKIAVLPLEQVVRIRTQETGAAALL